MNPANPISQERDYSDCQARVACALGASYPNRAFTLVEMIGVLAIVGIIAALLVPVAVRQIDRAAWKKEVSDLGAISNALVLQVVRNASIPGPTNWAQVASAFTQLPVATITTTPRGFTRALLVDGSGWSATNTYYSQDANGTPVVPNGARAMIVSCIAVTNLPVASSVVSAATFNNIWNTQDQTKPTSWSGWNGSGTDLVIQRLNFQPLFHRLVLWVRDPSSAPYYGINNSSLTLLSTSNNVDSYFLDTSVLNMYTNSTLVLTEIIKSDMSRVFDSGVWRDRISAGPPASVGTNLDSVAYNFVTSAAPSGSLKGDTVYGTAEMLLSYMLAYSSWSGTSPSCFSYYGGGQATKVQEYVLMKTVIDCFNSGNGNNTCTLVP